MKLAKVSIENFRHLGTSSQPFEVSFTDVLDRVHDFTLLVGPNTSGKTTVLDAIAAALGPSLEMPTLRPDFVLSPRNVVRRGALSARVTCWLRFSPDEIHATEQLLRLAAKDSPPIIDAEKVQLTWVYPDPRGESDFGFTECYPSYEGEALLSGRMQVMRLLRTGRVGWDWFSRVGGAFTFDQQRTGLARTISRQIWNVIHGTTEQTPENESRRTTDPKTALLDLAVRSLVPRRPDAHGQQPEQDDFSLLQQRYADVCAPRRVVGAVRDELGEFDVTFEDGENEYVYEGMSSGEKNVLLLLIRFVAERIHRSVVLIDELELNQHPIWQRRLLHVVPQMGDDNQIIATTHSPYLRDAVRPDAVIDLGSLGDHSTRGPR